MPFQARTKSRDEVTASRRVVHFERLPVPGGYSIERLFGAVRGALPRTSASSLHDVHGR